MTQFVPAHIWTRVTQHDVLPGIRDEIHKQEHLRVFVCQSEDSAENSERVW